MLDFLFDTDMVDTTGILESADTTIGDTITDDFILDNPLSGEIFTPDITPFGDVDVADGGYADDIFSGQSSEFDPTEPASSLNRSEHTGDNVSFGASSSDMREAESEFRQANSYQDDADNHFEKAERAAKDGRLADAERETRWGNEAQSKADMHKGFAERAMKRT